jgi:hypothetical protein
MSLLAERRRRRPSAKLPRAALPAAAANLPAPPVPAGYGDAAFVRSPWSGCRLMAIAYVGPLSRYFAAERGAVGAHPGVLAWRDDLRAAIAPKVAAQLLWDEAAPGLAATDLGDSGLLAVRLLAFLADRSDLEWPDTVPALLELDPEWRAAAADKFAKSRYGHLLACELWLPGDFPVTFRVPMPDGEMLEVGSLQVLADQLKWLNQRTFQADAEEVAQWLALPAPPGGAFVAAAQRGFAGMATAVDAALREHQPLRVRPV